MTASQSLQKLLPLETLGNQRIFVLPLKITVADGSFLHVGGTPSPLTEKKQPVFSVDGSPVIPASSFKGAFRHQVELLLIERKRELAEDLGLGDSGADLLKPFIPAPRPSKAEQDLFARGYRAVSQPTDTEIKVEDDKIKVPSDGLCPACYFFGAPGLEGFLRIPNFYPLAGEWRIEQTRIRIDRQTATAAPGAIVTGEQVKPGSVFSGRLYIHETRHGTAFGRCRVSAGTQIDRWLQSWSENDDTKRQLFLLNHILLPALANVKFLGGQKSLGGGRVEVTLDLKAT